MTAEVNYWDGIAENYSRKPVENPEAFERKIAITTEHMTSSSVVLDVGCGTGSLALRLAPHAHHIHGVDLSSEMVRIARTKALAARMDNVSFHVSSLEDCDLFEPGSLDGLCAFSLLHLMRDRAATLERFFQLLKPGGFFVSSTVCLGDSMVPYRPILAVLRKLGKAPPVRILRRRNLEQEIRKVGFEKLAAPDVGAKRSIAFLIATKPS